MLKAERGVKIAGEGTTAEEAIYLACNLLPNIILLSLDLTDSTLNTIRVIANECPATRVAFLTASEEDEHIVKPRERAHTNPLDELTERERQILEKLADGLSNKEIGQQLHLTEKTIRHYMTNILQKLQVRNRVEAALLAQKEIG